MYITCEQCSTIFRLDEKRLKPTGSKVRCSQCGFLFIARPTDSAGAEQAGPAPVRDTIAQPVAPPPGQPSQNTFDQELDGIDLAELDSILERGRSKEPAAVDDDQGYRSGEIAADEVEELDEADLDLDFESALALDEDQVAGTEVDTPPDEGEMLDLDMDFELESGPDLEPAGQEQAEGSDLDDSGLGEDIEMVLDDFEDALGEPEKAESGISLPEEAVEEDLSLDIDLDLEEETPAPAAEDQELELSADIDVSDSTGGMPETPSDDLDLGDLDALLDEEALPLDVEDEVDELELSLDDGNELELEEEDRTETPAAVPESLDDDFDLSGFDELLDEDQEAEEPEPEELELSLDDEAELELAEEPALEPEMQIEPQTGKPAAEIQDDDLDLAGLDKLLDDVEDQADESEPEELELSLDDEPEQASLEEPVLEMADDEKAEEELSGLEDLEFELDAEFEDKPVSKAAAEDQIEASAEVDEELDLSDIEKMLEGDTLAPEPSPQAEELDFDLPGGAEKWADEGGDDIGLGADGEIDLTEIEAAIDAADQDLDSGVDDDQELELDIEPYEEEKEEPGDELELELEMESDSSTADEGAFTDDIDEIDLSDLDLSIEDEKPEMESEIIDAGEIELEFQVEEEGAPSVIDSAETMSGSQATAHFEDTTFGAAGDDALIEEAFAPQPAVEKAPKKPAPVRKKKKKTSKSLVFLLILALLGGGGYYGYDYAVKNNIQIPYLNDAINYINGFINPKPKDPSGTAMLSTLEINSKFIENEKAGRIFVVTGKVRNGYNVPCKMIRLQGKLYTKGKMLVKTEQSYAGVVIGDQELAGQDAAQIKQRLKTAAGQAAALTVNPGQALPFMVVFSDLPAELDEFAIELLNSTKVQ